MDLEKIILSSLLNPANNLGNLAALIMQGRINAQNTLANPKGALDNFAHQITPPMNDPNAMANWAMNFSPVGQVKLNRFGGTAPVPNNAPNKNIPSTAVQPMSIYDLIKKLVEANKK